MLCGVRYRSMSMNGEFRALRSATGEGMFRRCGGDGAPSLDPAGFRKAGKTYGRSFCACSCFCAVAVAQCSTVFGQDIYAALQASLHAAYIPRPANLRFASHGAKAYFAKHISLFLNVCKVQMFGNRKKCLKKRQPDATVF